jgi:Flp pilus assembly protein TadD
MNDPREVRACTQCRVSSPLTSAFQQIGRGKKRQVLCPSCIQEEAHRQSQMTFIGFASLLILGSFVAAFGKTANPGWMLINVALVTVMAWVTILPHEAGHAFVAKLVGLEVDRIVVGIGRRLGTFMLFGVPIEVHLYPAGGVTCIAARDLPYIRWKLAAVTLAGPLVDIFLLWAAIELGETVWRAERIQGGLAPVCALIAALFLSIVFNLWPMRVSSAAGQTETDGARLVGLALQKQYDFKSAERSEDVARLNDLFAQRQWQDVVKYAEQCLQQRPNDYALQVTLSAALINLGKLEQGRALLEPLIEQSPAFEWQRAVAANNLAWLYLLLDDAALSEKSLALSESAYALLPWEPFITSTHAAAHALFGDAALAIRLFNSNRVRRNEPWTHASLFAGLAIAHARMGRLEDAITSLKRAQRVDPTAQLISIAQRRVTQT